MNKSSKKTLVLAWNVWSILNESKLQNFLQIVNVMNIDVACICETWFDSKNGVFSRMIKENKFGLHHAHRVNQRGGGVAIIYKEHLALKEGEASTAQFTSFEYAYVTLTLQSKLKVLLVCVYRKQEVAFSLFYDEFSSFTEKLVFKGDAVMFVGDFNVWFGVEDDVMAGQLMTLMNSYGLSQQVTEPTHRHGNILDHIYLNEFQFDLNHQVICDTLGLTTDHYPLLIKLPSSTKQHKQN